MNFLALLNNGNIAKIAYNGDTGVITRSELNKVRDVAIMLKNDVLILKNGSTHYGNGESYYNFPPKFIKYT